MRTVVPGCLSLMARAPFSWQRQVAGMCETRTPSVARLIPRASSVNPSVLVTYCWLKGYESPAKGDPRKRNTLNQKGLEIHAQPAVGNGSGNSRRFAEETSFLFVQTVVIMSAVQEDDPIQGIETLALRHFKQPKVCEFRKMTRFRGLRPFSVLRRIMGNQVQEDDPIQGIETTGEERGTDRKSWFRKMTRFRGLRHLDGDVVARLANAFRKMTRFRGLRHTRQNPAVVETCAMFRKMTRFRGLRPFMRIVINPHIYQVQEDDPIQGIET